MVTDVSLLFVVAAVPFIIYQTTYIWWVLKENVCARRHIPFLLVVLTTPLSCAICRLTDLAHHLFWGLQYSRKCNTVASLIFPNCPLFLPTPHSRYQALGAVDEKSYQRGDHKVLPLKNVNLRFSCTASYKKQQFSI